MATRFRTRKTAEILGRLAFSLGRPVAREELIEEHWPEAGGEQARNSLSQAVSSIRHLLEGPADLPGSVLEATRASLCLREEACATDLHEFRDALRRAESAKVRDDGEGWFAAAREAARSAVGELLPGAGGLWAATAREAHREQAVGLLTALGEHAAGAGQSEAALGYFLQAVENDPASEAARQAVIRMYDEMGRPEAAVRQYRQLARALKSELGMSPRPETKEMVQEAVRKPRKATGFEIAKPGGGDAACAPQATSPGRVPSPATRFFGRSAELAAVLRAFESGARLVTLLGPGGIGKTRLSIEAARALTPGFQERAWFSALAAATTDPSAWDTLAASLGVVPPKGGATPDAVVAWFGEAPGLLVLDNYEQLAGAGHTMLVTRLLEQCPNLRLVVSSRRRLEAAGESVVEVPPFELPPGEAGLEQLRESPAVGMFLDRASAVKPDFALTEGNRASVIELCALLEGVPLALELAASRVHVLSPAQMVERIDSRLDLLTSRGKEARHRSLRAAVSWSYDLLPPPLRRAYFVLAAFDGGFTLELAEAVLDDPLAADHVAELRDFSILTGGEADDGSIRFAMLETLREFARSTASAGEWEEAQRRRLAALVGFAEQSDPLLVGPGQAAALGRMEAENENFQGALDFAARSGMVDEALRLCAACWRFWHLRSHLSLGRALTSMALALEGGDPLHRARAMNGAGRLAYLQGDYEESARLHRCALELGTGDPDVEALALNALGAVAYEQGSYAEAVRLFEESLEMRRGMGDQFGVGNALSWLGIVFTDQGRYGEAQSALEESLRVRREIGDQGGVARSLNSLGIVARQTGRPLDAASLYREALAIHRELGDQRAVAGALGNLAIVQIGLGSLDEAGRLLEEARGVLEQVGDRWGIATNLAVRGQVAQRRGDAVAALRLGLEALALRRQIGNRWGVALSLEGIAEAVAEAEPACAARLLGAASRIREEVGSPMPPADREGLERLSEALSGLLGVAGLEKGRAEGRNLSDDEAALLAESLRPLG